MPNDPNNREDQIEILVDDMLDEMQRYLAAQKPPTAIDIEIFRGIFRGVAFAIVKRFYP